MGKGHFQNRSKLKFMTEKKSKRRRVGYFFLAFGLFAILLGGVSAVMLLKAYNYDLSNIAKGPEETETTEPETEPETENISGKADFLVVGTSNDASKIRFIAIIAADLEEKQFKVCSLPSTMTVLKDNGDSVSLSEQFNKNGAKGMAEVLKDYGINITRYVCIKDKSLKKTLNSLGGIVITLDEDIKYKNEEYDLNLSKGTQTLKGDAAVGYMNYDRGSDEKKLQEQADFICSVLDQSVIEKNTAKGEKLFNEIINVVDTDITAIDFGKTRKSIEILAKSENRKPSEAFIDIDKFRK